MIDFSLSEEQKALQELARDFARKEILPKAAYHDETGEYPRDILQKAWEIGLMNVHIPEKFGGLGLNALDGCLTAEEIAYACTGIGTAMEANNLASNPEHKARLTQMQTGLANWQLSVTRSLNGKDYEKR